MELPLLVQLRQDRKHDQAIADSLATAHPQFPLLVLLHCLHIGPVARKTMNSNKKYITISFGSAPHTNAGRVFKKAAATKNEHAIRKALEPWGEDRDSVIKAVAAGNFELLDGTVQITLPRNEEEI